ncbi:MAG TPA: glycosyltransferase [Paraburkholderia sp.]
MNAPSTLYARIVFWEPCVSPHKSAFINAVAERFGPGVEVSCVAHEGVPEARQALGWGDGSAALPPTVVAPSDEEIAALVQRGGDRCLHVFSGIRWFRTLTTALAIVQREQRPFAIMSEPRDNAGFGGAVRYVQSWMTEAALRRRVQFVLAIGRHGPPWFRSVGYRRERVFPFAYFLPPPAEAEVEVDMPRASAAQLRIAYVGRLIEKKGVQFLLPAMRGLARPARLTLIGDGELRERLVAQAKETGVDTEFCGVLPIEQVQRRMLDFDVLVLPSISKDDGWGAVVSEALMAGAAVVASHCAGASILVDNPRNGRVVRPGDSLAITAAINDLEGSGALSPHSRHTRMEWARERLTAHAGASYFEQIVRHRIGDAPRPKEFYL